MLAIVWATVASTRLFEQALKMTQQRWLVAYPVGLLYSVFVLITVF
jgi:protein YIPF5/7